MKTVTTAAQTGNNSRAADGDPSSTERGLESRAFATLGLTLVASALIVYCTYLFLAGPAWHLIDPGRHHSRMILISETLDAVDPGSNGALILALGDSICMSAFNADVFTELAGQPVVEAYNLGQSGKAMPELLFEAAHPTVQHSQVVLFISPLTTFTPEYINVYPRKANFYRALDFPLDHAAWDGYRAAVPDSNVDYVLKSKLFHCFELRWLVSNNLIANLKTTAVGALKRALKKPVATAPLTCDYTSIKYPGWDNESPAPEYQAHRDLLAAAKPELFAGQFNPNQPQISSFTFVVEQLAENCRGVVLVEAPLHPQIREELGEDCLAAFREFMAGYAGGNVQVIDLTESMPAEAFRDALHIVNDYSAEVTSALYNKMELSP